MKKVLLLFCVAAMFGAVSCSTKERAVSPTPGQKAMIERKYGMFLHYGMNTYLNAEWSDGTAAPSVYNPPADIETKAAQWVRNAKKAGMRSIVLTTKHHDGFCLWDSKCTDYDIANPEIKVKADIVRAVSDACQKEKIAFSIYYSLWDRHEPIYKDKDPYRYIVFMKKQLEELMTQYGPVAELWLDGAWDRRVEDWHLQEVYDHVKKFQPLCQISTNWTIGKRPVDMREGDSIIYFPADFRLWDPFLPVKNDPKVYTYKGKKYYLPFECTQTISVLGNWFAHPEDTTVRELEELEEIFHVATANDNCLLLNIPPNIYGDQNPTALQRINQLAVSHGFDNGKAFPGKKNFSGSITAGAHAEATSIRNNDTIHCGPEYAIDSDVSTAWTGDSLATLDVTLAQKSDFNNMLIVTGQNSILKYSIAYQSDGLWNDLYQGSVDPKTQPQSFMGYGFIELPFEQMVRTDKIRIKIMASDGKPSIYSIRLRKR